MPRFTGDTGLLLAEHGHHVEVATLLLACEEGPPRTVGIQGSKSGLVRNAKSGLSLKVKIGIQGSQTQIWIGDVENMADSERKCAAK